MPPPERASTSRRVIRPSHDQLSPTPQTQPEPGSARTDSPNQRTPGKSIGSSQRLVLPPGNENLETQPTVITKTPSLAQYPISGLHPRDMGRLLEGERLGHFELLEYVGGGGMGAVFRALDTMLNRTVAVKVLSQEQSSDDETLRRFQNEAQSAARLDHENISRVFYVGEDRGWHYIVFEFIEGINLRDDVGQRGALPLFDAVSYTLQLADALMHASRRDVVHRDIKPSNVLITPAGRAKLVDMGLARLHQVEPQGNDLTASGVTLGTFDYISPEQARDPRSADVRSDIYSLGCTLYFMLVARPPFPDGTVLQKLLQHQGDEPPDVRTFRSDLPDDFLTILNRMLAKSPEKRFQTPSELVAELTAFAARHGLEPAAPGSVFWQTPAPMSYWERNLPWMAPLAILFALVAVMSQIWSRAGHDSLPPPLQTAINAASSAPTNQNKTTNQGATQSSPSGSSSQSDSKGDLNSLPDRSVSPREPQGAGVSQRPGGETAADGASNIQPSGGPSPIRAAANGLIESAREWQNQVTRLIRDGFRNERLTSWWPSGQFASGAPNVPSNASHAAPSASPVDLQSGNAVPSQPISGNFALSKISGVLVVGGSQFVAGEYPSLAAACDAAKTGDIIELRFNGRLDERPIRLGNLNLTIRAADGYQPVLRFRPQEQRPAQSRRSAVVVAGGNLSLFGLGIELEVPRDLPADDWTFFELRQPEAVRLESCVLTVRNTTASGAILHPDVAFFRVHSSGVVATPLATEKGSRAVRASSVALQLRNCFARGAATFLQGEPSLPLAVQWDNGILATNERLFRASGNADPPPAEATVQLDFRHLTVLAEQGLVQMSATGDAPYLPQVEINFSDSILLVDPKSPLVLQSADNELDQLRRRISWKGDRIFYEGIVTFWRTANTENLDDFQVKQWQTFWGDHDQHPHFSGSWQTLTFSQPDQTEPQRLSPADFGLRPGDNPARHAGSDGRDVGCQIDLLPLPTRETVHPEPS
jgi:eukaryotic-like serine/threonine-protein kinase